MLSNELEVYTSRFSYWVSLRFRNMKSEINLVNSSLGCIFTIDGSSTSIGSLTVLTELFREAEGWVCNTGRGLLVCCGDTPGPVLAPVELGPVGIAFKGGALEAMGNATEDGEGGSSTRCRLRGRAPSLLASLPGRPSRGGISAGGKEGFVGR
jgi:hypothetical protein